MTSSMNCTWPTSGALLREVSQVDRVDVQLLASQVLCEERKKKEKKIIKKTKK